MIDLRAKKIGGSWKFGRAAFGDARKEADVRRAATRAHARSGRTEQPEAPAPRRATAMPSANRTSSSALVAPVWRRATLDDVIDAEIVSEELFS